MSSCFADVTVDMQNSKATLTSVKALLELVYAMHLDPVN
jgi:hypothetical protein